MFELTPLGVVIFLVGVAYLLTVGRRLTPARIPPAVDLVEEFDLTDHLAHVLVGADADVVGATVDAVEAGTEAAIDVLQIRRNGEVHAAPFTDERVQAGDTLIVHGSLQAVNQFQAANDLRQLTREAVTDATFDATRQSRLAKAVVTRDSRFAGRTVAESNLELFHRTTVLAIRRGSELFRTELATTTLRPGDLLLLRLPDDVLAYFADGSDLLVAEDGLADAASDRGRLPVSPKTPLALAIVAGVVLAAALDVAPIVVTALAGVFAMLVTGCLSPAEAYDAVSWNVVFLLAGVIPLGLALTATDGDALVATLLVATDAYLPLLGVVFVVYLVTAVLSNVITPIATVALMVPVAVEAAGRLSLDPFAAVLVVTFAGATSLMTPIGYQTNIMVYGPGGYRFGDFVRVGAPLQLLLAVVTTLGVAGIWGLA